MASTAARLVMYGLTCNLFLVIPVFPDHVLQSFHAQAADLSGQQLAEKDFQGLNFGLGVGIVGTPSNRLVRSASVANNIVRADDQSNVSASILLESHYFFENSDHPLWAHGPFVGIRPGGDNNQLIDSIGFGWMWGFRSSLEAKSSWNIGFAGTITPAAKVLGDGITKNQPLPAGETEARTKTATLGGFMILVSFAWNSFH